MNQRGLPTAPERNISSRTRARTHTGDQPAHRRHPSNPQKTSRKHALGGVIPYYGYRWYDPVTGRWPSRDPIEENGGVNVYRFASNDPLSFADIYGLALYAFDGTNNNKDIDLGRHADKNGPTNVAILYDIYKSERKHYEHGVGTKWEGLFGGAFGLGGQQRTRSMLKALKANIKAGDCTVDIIGFSRGAALARNFANEALNKYPKLTIRWMGVFDTVASFGLPGNGNNVGYNFNISNRVKRVYHVVASQSQKGGEYRKNFPVTSIYPTGQPPRNSSHMEVFVNGAHSDIGGGYHLYDDKGMRKFKEDFRSHIPNYTLKLMHQDGVSHGVPFGSIPPQYRDTSRGGNWHINDSVSDSIGMEGEKDGIRRAYGSNGELLPRGWTYKPF